MRNTNEMDVLVDPDLLVLLMKRTGDGKSVSVRDLAAEAGVHPSKVGFLRNGSHKSAPHEAALAIARRLGVDHLVLWAPVGRAVPAPAHDPEAVPA
jgi:lambda repressor-like predicted transcriptional regulator